MMPSVSLPLAQTLPMPPATALAHATMPSGAELPFAAVPALATPVGVFNNSRAPYSAAPKQTVALATAGEAPATALMATRYGSEEKQLPRFSSPFLAQLLAQAMPSDAVALSFLTTESTALSDNQRLQVFSFIKFKPSMADAERYQPPRVETSSSQPVEMADAPQPMPAVPQPVMMSETLPTEAPIQFTLPLVTPAVTEALPVPVAKSTVQTKVRSTENHLPLTKQTGVDAYRATAARNAATLKLETPPAES